MLAADCAASTKRVAVCEAEEQAHAELAVAEHEGEDAVTERAVETDGAAIAANGNDRTDELVKVHGGVRVHAAVALQNEMMRGDTDEAVSGENAWTAIEDDLANAEIGDTAALGGDDVAGPDRGQHAGTGEPECYFAGSMGDFGNELAAGG